MRLRLMNLVMLPAQTLHIMSACYVPCGRSSDSYLSDTKCAPFLLPKQLQRSVAGIMVIFGDSLEHGFGKLHMTVLEFAVGIPGCEGLGQFHAVPAVVHQHEGNEGLEVLHTVPSSGWSR